MGVHGRRAQLHQGQEEGLQRGVQGLEQGEAQAQALDGHVCGAREAVRLGSQQSKAETPFVTNSGGAGPLWISPPHVPVTKGQAQAGQREALG